ncbi:histone deacetylase 15 isoform X2 [Durio zibethinus]|uniref:histone deacetylase n=1 Tax=Durio zibethinus TaxID=66656 RepID=A0A6P5Y7V2_DURZI|nr:histone deacetylase 15 isoform X2 [Durio zibethinus]
MVSETVQVSCLTNGGAKNNQGFKRKHLGSGELTTASCHDGVSDDKGSIGTSSRHMTANINEDTQPDGVSKKVRLPKELTFQDMYNNQDAFDDDDDEDDSDWEPVQKHIEILKWFCTNCTMVNLDDVVHCDICGEHKESGIVRHGFYASPCSPEVDLIQVESEARGREKDLHSEASASNCSTAVGFDERMLLHSEVEMKSHPHPERPDRLRAIAASLAAAGIFPGKCCPIPAREITHEELQMVHSLEHIETVELTSQIFSSYFTPDTYANEHSAYAARLAAGLCADLASAIFSGCMRNGFALVRPPGHHAGVTQAMGFCLHNNAAVAAFAAQVAGAKKVLIVDWDVHHGNGTQEIFDQNKSVLYISLHRHEGGKFYPGTGAAFEVGSKGAEGYCVNIPWSRGGVGDNDYIFAFQHVVLPIASKFAPDFTIISAGFDAARGDPLGSCDVTPAGYAQMTHMLGTLSNGKLLVILEGGYNLRSISSSATAVIKVLLGESYGCEPENIVPSKAGLHTVLEVLKIQMKYWPTLSSSLEKLQSQWGMYSMENKRGSSVFVCIIVGIKTT